MFLFYLICFTLFYLSFLEINNKDLVKNPVVYILVFLLLLSFVGLKLPGISKDDLNYIESFEMINSFSEYFKEFSTFSFHEPAFHFLVVVFKFFFLKKFYLYFLFFALIALLIKFKTFNRYSEYFYLSLAVYFSLMLPMHEMTQIRIAIGGGVVLYAWFLYSEGKTTKSLLLFIIAFLFHYSSLIGLSVFLFSTNRPTIYYYIIIMIMFVLGIVFKFDSKAFIISLNISGISDKIAAYKMAEDSGFIVYEKSNIYNVVFLSKLALFGFLTFWSQRLPSGTWYHLFYKLFGLSLGVYVMLSADPTISIRISDLLGLSVIFLISSIPALVEEKYFATVLIFIYCFSLLSIALFNDKLFTTYKFFFQV